MPRVSISSTATGISQLATMITCGYNTVVTTLWLQQRGYNSSPQHIYLVGVESTDLVLCLLVPTEPVHDGDRQPARGDLLVALHVELVVDVLDGVVLVLPGLDTGAQVTPSHYHRLQEQSSAVQG